MAIYNTLHYMGLIFTNASHYIGLIFIFALFWACALYAGKWILKKLYTFYKNRKK